MTAVRQRRPYYRERLLLLARVFILPPILLSTFLQFRNLHLGYAAFPCHILFALLCAFGRGAYVDFIHARDAKRMQARLIPRVVGKWPGNIDVLARMMKAFKNSYVLDVYLDLYTEYQSSTLNLRIFWLDMIISMDEACTKHILATGFNDFWRGTSQKERMETFLGTGIFNRDDQAWKQHRGTARPFFARERISDFETFEKYTSRTIAKIASISASNAPCETQDMYARFTLDAASEFLFGQNLDTLSGSLPIPGVTPMGPKGSATPDSFGSFTAAFEEVQLIVTHRSRLGYFWPLFELLSGDKTARAVRTIREWLDPIVAAALRDKARMRKVGVVDSPVEDKTFLQHLADSTEDPAYIRDELLNILLASRDTTACLLTFTTYFMALHPDVARRMREEVLQHCGPSGRPTYESLRNLQYMRAVLNETLRLFPPVPLNVRESRPAPCVVPTSASSSSQLPIYFPPNTIIMFMPLLTQRDPKLWGEDADVFDPERWLDPEKLAQFTKNPMMFTPFSAGPRICIGQNYAYNEASYFLVRLLQQFDTFTLAPEVQPAGSLPPPEWKSRRGRQAFEQLWPANALTLYVKGGLWVRFGKTGS